MRKLRYIISLILLLAFYFLVIHSPFKVIIADSFFEKGKEADVYFYFLEVNRLDSSRIEEYANKLFSDFIQDKDNDKTILMVSHFYIYDDAKKLDDSIKKNLLLRYPKSENLSEKLNYFYSGYIFTKSNRKLKRFNNNDFRFFKSDFIAPKREYQAKYILKNKYD